jgi:hypothetical protein
MTAQWFSTECGGGAGQRMPDSCLGKWGARRSRNGALTVCDEGFEGAGIVPLAYEENVSNSLVAVEGRTSFAERMAPVLECLEFGQHVLQRIHGQDRRKSKCDGHGSCCCDVDDEE